jgi:beta-glucanase (GH16 family)
MHLVFNGTFSGHALDTHTWATCYPLIPSGAGCSHVSGNPEVEWYLPSQDQVSNGVLHLVANPASVTGTAMGGPNGTYPCFSGMITTFSSFAFTYGYVQMVARMPNPKNLNLWPAFWMLPNNPHQFLPEIDVIELIGSRSHGYPVVFHAADGSVASRSFPTISYSRGWHTFAVDWEPDSIIWFVDGKPMFEVTQHVPRQPMFLLADLAIVDNLQRFSPSTSCVGSFDIRSIQVWQS